MATQQTINKIRVANPPLEDNARAFLTQDVAAGATTIPITSTLGFPGTTADDFYAIIGDYGDEKAEIVLVAASSLTGTAATISPLVKSHEASDPVTYVGYNKINFYGLSTPTSSTHNLITSKDIDTTEQYTEYTYTATAYSYFSTAYFDEANDEISSYSEIISSTSFTRRSAESIVYSAARRANTTIDENKNSRLNLDIALEILQDGLDEIAAKKKRWAFWHTIDSSESTVATVPYISKPDDLTQLETIKVGDRYLRWITPSDYRAYSSGVKSTGKPEFYTERNGLYYLYPVPDSAYVVEKEYYKVPDVINNMSTELPIPLIPVLKYYCSSRFANIRGNETRASKDDEMFNSLLMDQIEEYTGPMQDGDAEYIDSTSELNEDF